MRKRYSASFKAKVALEAIKEHKTLSELSSTHGIHKMLIQKWKKLAVDNLPNAFSGKQDKGQKEEHQKLIDSLYREIGKLTIEKDWLKKKSESFDL